MRKLVAISALISMSIFNSGSAGTFSSDDSDALLILDRASRIEDYSEYDHFLKILGFGYSHIEARTVKDERFSPPKIYGEEKRFTLKTHEKNKLSNAVLAPELVIYQTNDDNKKNVRFSIGVDPKILCIKKENFSRVFGPLEIIRASDFGPTHLERKFTGSNNRAIVAYFSENDCATKIYLVQQ